MNPTVCFKSWTHRLRGVVGGVRVPCPALVLFIAAVIDQAFEACSASAVLPVSPISSWFARVVVSYGSLESHSHFVGDGFRFQLRSWPGRYTVSRRFRW